MTIKTSTRLLAPLSVAAAACGATPPRALDPVAEPTSKQRAVDLLASIETGDPAPLAYVGAYKQHNLNIPDGPEGLQAVLAQLPPDSARVKTVRALQDGDFVVTHTEYNFFGPKIGFDVFRFENGKIAEHWDNLTETPKSANPSGRTMTDGPSELVDLDRTTANKQVVASFMDDILLGGRFENIGIYVAGDHYVQHNPLIGDGIRALAAGLEELASKGLAIKYDRVHKVLGEGNFVLTMSEGTLGGAPTAYYDLFRLESGKIVEHWDVIEAIPARDQWKNQNGKF